MTVRKEVQIKKCLQPEAESTFSVINNSAPHKGRWPVD